VYSSRSYLRRRSGAGMSRRPYACPIPVRWRRAQLRPNLRPDAALKEWRDTGWLAPLVMTMPAFGEKARRPHVHGRGAVCRRGVVHRYGSSCRFLGRRWLDAAVRALVSSTPAAVAAAHGGPGREPTAVSRQTARRQWPESGAATLRSSGPGPPGEDAGWIVGLWSKSARQSSREPVRGPKDRFGRSPLDGEPAGPRGAGRVSSIPSSSNPQPPGRSAIKPRRCIACSSSPNAIGRGPRPSNNALSARTCPRAQRSRARDPRARPRAPRVRRGSRRRAGRRARAAGRSKW
jgi:hypothetical protein